MSILNPLRLLKYKFFPPKEHARYQQLYDTIDQVKPRVILEVGTWAGGRAVRMLAEAAKHRPVEEIHYIGFDLFESLTGDQYKEEISKQPPTQAEVEALLKKTGASYELVVGNTLETMPRFVEALPKDKWPEFVYIDGGHHVETVRSDWENTTAILPPGGVVIFDDYWPERGEEGGCKLIVDDIDRNLYEVEIMPVVDTFENPDFGRVVVQYAKVTKK